MQDIVSVTQRTFHASSTHRQVRERGLHQCSCFASKSSRVWAVTEKGAAICIRPHLLPAYCFLAYLPQRSFLPPRALQLACTRYLSQLNAPLRSTNKKCARHCQSDVSGQSLDSSALSGTMGHDKKTHGYGYRSSYLNKTLCTAIQRNSRNAGTYLPKSSSGNRSHLP